MTERYYELRGISHSSNRSVRLRFHDGRLEDLEGTHEFKLASWLASRGHRYETNLDYLSLANRTDPDILGIQIDPEGHPSIYKASNGAFIVEIECK